MAENKFLNKKTALVAGGLVAAYLIYKQTTSAKEGLPEGSLGGEDELEGQQGFDIDPNNPSQGDYNPNESYFYVMPDGTIQPSPTPTNQTPDGTSGIPSSTPTYSSGSGSLVTDAAVLGGALGFNALLPSLGKGIKNAVDSKYVFKAEGEIASESNVMKWLKDPYNVGDSAASKVMRQGEQTALQLSTAADRPIVKEAEQQVLRTAPKWAKGVKGVANFIPILDIPIGAGLDVYFSKYEEDPSKRIGWGDAFAANTAGELAQLGITGGAALAGTVVPVAGNIAGGVGGFVVGTGADIAATEGYYKARGKSSLFDWGSSSTPQQQTVSLANNTYSTPNKSTIMNFGVPATQNFNVNIQQATSGSSGGSSTSQAQAQQQLYSQLGIKTSTNPFTSSGSSSGGSSSSSKSSSSSQNMSVAPKTSTSSSAQSSAAVSASKAPATSPVSKVASSVSSAAKTTVSAVSNAAKSAVSKVTSIFKSKKK